MLGVAVKMLKSRRDAEEMVHDVFLEAWSHAGDYDPARSSVKTWLLLRLRSRCLDLMRSPARMRTEPLEGGYERRGAGHGPRADAAGPSARGSGARLFWRSQHE
jgi:RNA polymerase sigma-70 factor (ECF subfamily)